MPAILLVHVTAGALALAFGYTALFAAKGMRLHRKSGTYFVAMMLVMAVAGLFVATVRGVAPAINVPAALLTIYLVVTALATVRPPVARARLLHLGAFLCASALGLSNLALGIDALGAGVGGMVFPLFLFGAIALAGAKGDLGLLRSGRLEGARRLARHLWRMCTALLIAALSFFIGQSDELPETLRIFPLLVLPIVVALAAMIFWLRRIKAGRVRAPGAG